MNNPVNWYSTAGRIILVLSAMFWTVSAVAQVPKDTTICDINMLNGVEVGDLVRVSGVCTVGTDRLGGMICIIATPEGGPFCCGLKIYDMDSIISASIGQCLTVIGTIEEFYGAYEIKIDHAWDQFTWECGWKIPDPERLPDCTITNAYTSCLVVFEGLTVTTVPDQYGNFTAVDRYGCEHWLLLRLTDPVFQVGTEICALTGFMDYRFDEFVLRPVDDSSFDMRPLSECPWTGTACDPVAIRLYLSKAHPECYGPGDDFIHTLTFANLCLSRDAMLFDVLNIAGGFWFWPGWSTAVDYKTVTLPELAGYWENILSFTWPDNISVSLDGIFWAAALDSDTGMLISDLASKPFCFDPSTRAQLPSRDPLR